MNDPAASDDAIHTVLARGPVDEDGISVLRIIAVILRRLPMIVGLSGILAVYALVSGLTSSRTWSSDASFMPQSSSAPSSVSSLAAQFGLGGETGEPGQSPQFYVDLIGTREILRGVVRSTYTVRTDSGTITGDLVKLDGIKKKPTNDPEASAMKMLRTSVSAAPSVKTGVITLRVSSPYRDLPAQIIKSFFAQINQFNLVGRQSRASAERQFTEQRLHDVQGELTAAEDDLEQFLNSNRDIKSPSLQLRQERLNRVVATRQQVYTALAQSFEQAKIDELRDTPAITVIDPPVVPIEPDARGTIGKTAKSLVFGALIGIMLALLLDYFERSGGRDSAAYIQLAALTKRAFTSPFRRAKSA